MRSTGTSDSCTRMRWTAALRARVSDMALRAKGVEVVFGERALGAISHIRFEAIDRCHLFIPWHRMGFVDCLGATWWPGAET